MKRPVFFLALIVGLSTIVAAQLRVDVSLINVVATVTDSHGRYVPDLRAEDFILEEDGKVQTISHFARSNDLPVSVGIVLDTSRSMERKITTATRAVDKFIRTIHADDDIFLMTFDENTRVRQDFTSDRGKLTKALDGVRLGNGTALFDGLIDGLDKIKKGKHNKKAILLISDGADTSSEHDFNVAMLVTRESEVLVYCLGIAPDGSLQPSQSRSPIPAPRNPPTTSPRLPIPGTNFPFPLPIPLPGRRALPPQRTPGGGRQTASMDTIDMTTLDEFAEASGGNSWLISTSERRSYQIEDALDEIADELRNQYTIGYYPGHELKDGKWHSIDLRTKNRDYDVRAKREYFGQ